MLRAIQAECDCIYCIWRSALARALMEKEDAAILALVDPMVELIDPTGMITNASQTNKQGDRMRVKLGDRVKDKDSWYTGTVVAISEYLRGTPRFGVKSGMLHDGKPVAWEWFDEEALEPAPDNSAIMAEAREDPTLIR